MIDLDRKIELVFALFEDEALTPYEFETFSLDDTDIEYGKDEFIFTKLMFNQLVSDFNIEKLFNYLSNDYYLWLVDYQGYRFEVHGSGSYFYIKDSEDAFLFKTAKKMISSLVLDDYDLTVEEKENIMNL